jgi:hypothetical protein
MLFAAVHELAIGPKRTSLAAPHMSAFGGKADIVRQRGESRRFSASKLDLIPLFHSLSCENEPHTNDLGFTFGPEVPKVRVAQALYGVYRH